LGAFMRADRAPADDFDLYHRLLRVGEIARLEEVLTIYRWHATNASHAQGTALVARAVDVLAEACTPWFGPAAGEAARLVIWHLSERHPATDRATLARLGEVLERLLAGFCATHPMPPATRAAIARAAGRAWWGAVRAAVRSGHPALLAEHRRAVTLRTAFRPTLPDRLASCAIGGVRGARHSIQDRFNRP
ncbi:MAG: hypothetical protein KGL55_09785, partial [Rhodospirillales bacterium]|nr:hypothetical protein [Rhodospirillales bacterium]